MKMMKMVKRLLHMRTHKKNTYIVNKEIIYIYSVEPNIPIEFLKNLKKLLEKYYVGVKFKIKKAIDISLRDIKKRISPVTERL